VVENHAHRSRAGAGNGLAPGAEYGVAQEADAMNSHGVGPWCPSRDLSGPISCMRSTRARLGIAARQCSRSQVVVVIHTTIQPSPASSEPDQLSHHFIGTN